jgi:hypothetical protein
MQTRIDVPAIIHRRAFMAASAATVFAPDVARAQAPVPNQLGWGTMTRADRDAAYNNLAAVSDSAQIMERVTAASAALRAPIKTPRSRLRRGRAHQMGFVSRR